MARTEPSACILLEFVREISSYLALEKVSCFWTHAELHAAQSKLRVIQCRVFGGMGFQDLSWGLRPCLGISGFRS